MLYSIYFFPALILQRQNFCHVIYMYLFAAIVMLHRTGRRWRRLGKTKQNAWGILCEKPQPARLWVVEPPSSQLSIRCYHLHLFLHPPFPPFLSIFRPSLSMLKGLLRSLHLTSVLQQMHCLLAFRNYSADAQQLPSIRSASRTISQRTNEYKPLLFSPRQKLYCSCNRTLTPSRLGKKKKAK